MTDPAHYPQGPGSEKHGNDVSLVRQAIILTFVFFIVEVAGGYLSGSLSLFSDAAHMLSDLSALLLTFGALPVRAETPLQKIGHSAIIASKLQLPLLMPCSLSSPGAGFSGRRSSVYIRYLPSRCPSCSPLQ